MQDKGFKPDISRFTGDEVRAILPYIPSALNMISWVTVKLLRTGAILEAIEKHHKGGKDAVSKSSPVGKVDDKQNTYASSDTSGYEQGK